MWEAVGVGRLRELIIYADESEGRGRYYSNFFGGALVSSKHLQPAIGAIADAKRAGNLHGEIKWSKVTSNYLSKYQAVMDTFFEQVAENRIKVRIMFTANRHVPRKLTKANREHAYFLLYYQFLKHAFGLRYAPAGPQPVSCRLYLDALPDTKENVAKFKGYLAGLSASSALKRHVRFRAEDIAEVNSRDHDILQCLDIILGAMQFRLNNKHKCKPAGQRRRGRRTIAKEKLYRYINRAIRRIYPGFNVGISTGGSPEDRWRYPYRHWLFVPAEYEYDHRFEKP
jgi:hypothetical protein